MSTFVKIRLMVAELFHAHRRTDRHGECNSRFPQFCERASKYIEIFGIRCPKIIEWKKLQEPYPLTCLGVVLSIKRKTHFCRKHLSTVVCNHSVNYLFNITNISHCYGLPFGAAGFWTNTESRVKPEVAKVRTCLQKLCALLRSFYLQASTQAVL